VKLGKNASDTCALVSEDYGGEAMKKSGVFEWHKWFKDGLKNIEDESSSHPTYNKTKELKNCIIWCIQSAKLILWKYWNTYMKLCILKKAETLAQQFDSPP